MNAEMKKMIVDKVNENRRKSLENQVATIALNIQQQLDYLKNQQNSVKVNIEANRKQLEALNGALYEPLSAEDIFGREGK